MSLQITWLGQAGYLLDDGTTRIAIDPFCGEARDNTWRLYPPSVEPGTKVDCVLSTHAHWDHFDLTTYETYVIPGEIIAPPTCIRLLRASHLADRIPGTELFRGDTVERGAFTITAVMADHDGDSCGYLIQHSGKRLYFTGDTLFSTLLMLLNVHLQPDVMFVCINGKGLCMSYQEAALYARLLGAKAAVPMHYDMISNNNEDPQQFVDLLAQISPATRGVILQRGQAVALSAILS